MTFMNKTSIDQTGNEQVYEARTLTLDSLVAGIPVPSDKYVHTIHADAMLTDAFAWMTRKRLLDRNRAESGTDITAVSGRTALGTTASVELALQAGHSAAKEWASRPAKVRREFVLQVNAALQTAGDQFVELLVAEGHPRRLAEWELDGALKGSSAATYDFCDSLVGKFHEVAGSTVGLRRRPVGLVGMVPSQNAAASTSLLGIPALAAGNALIVKPPRSSPLATAWVWQEVINPVLESVGAPAGTLSVICAPPQATIDRWLSSGGVDCLFFVGSSDRGLRLGQRCMENGVKPVLELSGNDSLVVWKDADARSAARSAAECFYGSAQICMVPKRVAVHPDVADEFLQNLEEECRTLRPGLPSDKDVLLSPVLDPIGFSETLAEAVEHGAKVLTGGHTVDLEGRPDPTGVFVEPTVVRFSGTRNLPNIRAIQEETFYPLLPVVVWEPGPDEAILDEMVAFTCSNAYGLRNSLWTGSREVADYWLQRVSNGGILKVNTSHIGFSEILPTHGGTGRSGGPFGEANYPSLMTSQLQAVQIGQDSWTDGG